MNRLSNYYFTLKDLSLIQIWFRIYYIIKRYFIKVFHTNVDKHYQNIGEKGKSYALLDNYPIVRRKYYDSNLSNVLRNKLVFLNTEINFGKKIDWNREDLNCGTRLWKLNLHYHEFLIELAYAYVDNNDKEYLEYIVDTIRDWDASNPIGLKEFYKDSWNSYAISMRVISWIKIIHILKGFLDKDTIEYMVSLVIKNVYYLKNNIEYDILGNHIVKNWNALYTAGIFLRKGDLKKRANAIFKKHILYQFSKTGMHEELSPMYAGIVLEDLMEVYAFSEDHRLKEISEKLLCCVQKLTDFERNYLFFNDSVCKNGVQLSDLVNMANKLGFQKDNKEELYYSFDGFYVKISSPEIFVFDAGDLVFGHQPGHAHCDALSFEYCNNGRKIFTNSGVYEYNNTEKRRYCRSTRAHNTVVVGNEDQSVMWGSFRVAQKAKVSCEVIKKTQDELKLVGKVRNRKSLHTREIVVKERRIDIFDTIESNKAKDFTTYLHLVPDFYYVLKEDEVEIRNQTDQVVGCVFVKTSNGTKITIEKTPFYPEFGKEMEKETLIILKELKRVGCNKISIRMDKI